MPEKIEKAAAFFAYPFTSFKDDTLVQATIVNGKLANKGAFYIVKDIAQHFKTAPRQVTTSFLVNATKHLPLRMGLTG